ncbi:hypothetical protein CMESO_64 (nucleomorph) [Chroomonas mesostigmatica CCMP1168]|uniref:Uncharacterized protein n=1 Tax=Chroomonas mesostigmatica CCMP1168 TaxID=1195612 RepID=J7G9V1_9CRYP|nr:hypothetical protein CMESO_64 [Chroomonas mesostigmatica CCMP1168]
MSKKKFNLDFTNTTFFILKQSFKSELLIFSIIFEIITLASFKKKKKFTKFSTYFRKKQLYCLLISRFFFFSFRNLRLKKKKSKKQEIKNDILKLLFQKFTFSFFFQIPQFFTDNIDLHYYFCCFILPFLKCHICPMKFIGYLLLKKFNEKLFHKFKNQKRRNSVLNFPIQKKFSCLFLIKISKDLSEEVRILSTLHSLFLLFHINKKKNKISTKKFFFSKKEQIILLKKNLKIFKSIKTEKKKTESTFSFYELFNLTAFLFIEYKIKNQFPDICLLKKWVYLETNQEKISRWLFIQNSWLNFGKIKKKIMEIVSSYFRYEAMILLNFEFKKFIKKFLNRKNLIFLSIHPKFYSRSHFQIPASLYLYHENKKSKKISLTLKNCQKKPKKIQNIKIHSNQLFRLFFLENFLCFYFFKPNSSLCFHSFLFFEKETVVEIRKFFDFKRNHEILFFQKNIFFLLIFFSENVCLIKKILEREKSNKENKFFIFCKSIHAGFLNKNFDKTRSLLRIKRNFLLKKFFDRKKINLFCFFLFKEFCKKKIFKKKIYFYEIKIFTCFLFLFSSFYYFLFNGLAFKIFSKNLKIREKFCKIQNEIIKDFFFKNFFFKTQKIKKKIDLLFVFCKLFFYNIKKKNNKSPDLPIFWRFYILKLSFYFMKIPKKENSNKLFSKKIDRINKKKFEKIFNICFFRKKLNSEIFFVFKFFFSKKIDRLEFSLNDLKKQNKFFFKKNILFNKKILFYLNLQLNGILIKKKNILFSKKKLFQETKIFFFDEKRNLRSQKNYVFLKFSEIYLFIKIKKNFPKFTSLTKFLNLPIFKENLWNKKLSINQKALKKICLRNFFNKKDLNYKNIYKINLMK